MWTGTSSPPLTSPKFFQLVVTSQLRVPDQDLLL